jgi:hypothetical protein
MKAAFYGTFLLLCVLVLGWISWDILFSPPTLQDGVITELINIPAKAVTTYTPYQGRKVGDHAILVQREEQHIAVVRLEDGEEYQVHCHKEHYDKLSVGDHLQFKKYEGGTFHIRWFAHYEDQ